MSKTNTTPLDPNNTICVVKKNGKVLTRIPVTAPNAQARLTQLALEHEGLEIDYEEDQDANILASLSDRRRF